jgi:glutamate-1-semialdehyde aminotransferase
MSTKLWLDRSKLSIAQGSLTNSKHPDTDVLGVFPTHFEKGYGSYLYTTEGTRYLDFVSGLGAINLGYANEQLENTVMKVSGHGGCLSGNTVQEIFTAERVKATFHWCDRVKFLNDGTEACMAAIRMARAFTGKDIVLWEGYHGWYDEATAWNDNAVGTPLGHRFQSLENFSIDLDKFNHGYFKHDIAAIIMEPVMVDDSKDRINYLKKIKEFCDRHRIVLIFDEVITGMRYPSLSVAKHWNIYPDLICLGKACANGYKIGIVAGRSDILDGDYFVSGTYFGHIPSLKATDYCMYLSKHDTKYDVDDLNERALLLKDRFNSLSPEIIKFEGWGARMNFVGSDLNVALFRQELVENRIFTKKTFFLNHATKHHIDEFMMVSEFALKKISDGKAYLKGPMPRKAVAQIIRERQ